ncbi:MAG: hypothetical protein U9P10_11375, partial [Thermodesulfobacteriota bacterium]|nr:hypothetical protein [Thermodesulfobacteriota bacterium]
TVSGFSTEAENNFYEKTRVKGSSVRIPIPEPGRWFVRYFIKTDAAGEDQKLCNQMKQTASLVFEIKKQGTPVKAGMLQ